jgi:putative endonuclease
MRYYVYILFSLKIQKFYIGQTSDVDRRFKRHNSGTEKYTSKGVPWELVWFTSKESRSDAMILEKKLKNLKQLRLLRFMQKYADEIQNIQIIEMLEKKL